MFWLALQGCEGLEVLAHCRYCADPFQGRGAESAGVMLSALSLATGVLGLLQVHHGEHGYMVFGLCCKRVV